MGPLLTDLTWVSITTLPLREPSRRGRTQTLSEDRGLNTFDYFQTITSLSECFDIML